MSTWVRLGEASEREHVRAIERRALVTVVAISERLTNTRKRDEESWSVIRWAHPFNASGPLHGIEDHEADAVDHLALVVGLEPCSSKHRRDNLVRCTSTVNKLTKTGYVDQSTDRQGRRCG